MINRKIIYINIMALFIAILFSGCMTKQDYTLAGGQKENSIAPSEFEPYRIKKGDRLAVIIAKHPEISTRSDIIPPSSDIGHMVNSAGTISVPLAGHIKVEGLSICEATIEITERLREYVKNPQVTVDLVNPKIFLIGEVNKPGVVRVDKSTLTIFEAIAYAEDFSPYADRSTIKIIRGNPKSPEVYEVDSTKLTGLQQAPFIYPNDIIYVSPTGLKAFNTSLSQILFALTGSVYYLDGVITRKTRF